MILERTAASACGPEGNDARLESSFLVGKIRSQPSPRQEDTAGVATDETERYVYGAGRSRVRLCGDAT